jgi:hypothetical protein
MLGRARRDRVRETAALVSLAACLASCVQVRDPIVVRDGMLVLENQTAREWRNVRVTINDHFTGGVPSLPAHGLLNAPLRDFQSGFGHRFDRGRMSVFKVRVVATDIDGRPIALSWGK